MLFSYKRYLGGAQVNWQTVLLRNIEINFSIFHSLRAPIWVGIIGALILSLPDQTLEIYRIMAENLESDGAYLRPALSFILLLIVIFGFWVCVVDITSYKNILNKSLKAHFDPPPVK